MIREPTGKPDTGTVHGLTLKVPSWNDEWKLGIRPG
jgi:hypothetical protein